MVEGYAIGKGTSTFDERETIWFGTWDRSQRPIAYVGDRWRPHNYQ